MNAATASPVRAQPNVTPMIDVMLVLLIIFMAVGPLLATGMRATPPEARFSAKHPDEGGDAVIGIDAMGRLYLDKMATDTTTLRARLMSRFTAHPADRVVYLRADRSLPYDRVQSVMTLASSAGAGVVGLVSESPADHDRH